MSFSLEALKVAAKHAISDTTHKILPVLEMFNYPARSIWPKSGRLYSNQKQFQMTITDNNICKDVRRTPVVLTMDNFTDIFKIFSALQMSS